MGRDRTCEFICSFELLFIIEGVFSASQKERALFRGLRLLFDWLGEEVIAVVIKDRVIQPSSIHHLLRLGGLLESESYENGRYG